VGAEHAALDAVGGGGGALLGAKLGLAAGLALAPVTGGVSALLIPKLVVVGGALGGATGKMTADWVKSRKLRKAQAALEAAAGELVEAFFARADLVAARAAVLLRERRRRLAFAREQLDPWYRRHLFPSLMGHFYQRAAQRCLEEETSLPSWYATLDRELRALEPKEAGLRLHAQGPAALAGEPVLTQKWSAVERIGSEVSRERHRLA
jgi:hypothetical protein